MIQKAVPLHDFELNLQVPGSQSTRIRNLNISGIEEDAGLRWSCSPQRGDCLKTASKTLLSLHFVVYIVMRTIKSSFIIDAMLSSHFVHYINRWTERYIDPTRFTWKFVSEMELHQLNTGKRFRHSHQCFWSKRWQRLKRYYLTASVYLNITIWNTGKILVQEKFGKYLLWNIGIRYCVCKTLRFTGFMHYENSLDASAWDKKKGLQTNN